MIALTMISNKIGYQTNLTKLPILLMASLLCSIMPQNFMVLVSAGFILAHLYKLSIFCAAIALIVFLLMFLLYFRFSPKDTIAVMLTPMCFYIGVPYVMPIALGLMGTPTSIISMACGIIVAFFVNYISGSATTLTDGKMEEAAAQFQTIISELLNNKSMWVFVGAFSITLAIVYFIRRMSIDHAWTIAIVSGALADIVCLLIGDMIYTTELSFVGVIFQTFISIVLLLILQFFAFNLDYSRIEKVQFEDDEYYYYVKAVPKVTVSTPSPKVKRISGQSAGKDYRGKDRGE
ncbi:hypothetical protein [Butyrivibrio sp. JL13D10]|uniref:hypothetical protein n=1 Tax=Butyrivibrio sp. JL13D10 TaxID=3236815 RepID=UPI0038B5DF9C